MLFAGIKCTTAKMVCPQKVNPIYVRRIDVAWQAKDKISKAT